MLEETLLVNAEGLLIVLFAYLIFSKFHLRDKIRKGELRKRISAVFIYCVFWGSIFYLILDQNHIYQQTGGQNLSWYLIFWVVFSNWQFYLMPVYQEYKEKMKR